MNAKLAAWKKDPVLFITEVLRDPETGKPFELYPAQERFLREALTLTKGGRLPFPDGIRRAQKKRQDCAGGDGNDLRHSCARRALR